MDKTVDRVLMKLALRLLEHGLKDKCQDILVLAEVTESVGSHMPLIEGLHAYSSGNYELAIEYLDGSQERGEITPDMQKSFQWVRAKAAHMHKKNQERNSEKINRFADRVREFETRGSNTLNKLDEVGDIPEESQEG